MKRIFVFFLIFVFLLSGCAHRQVLLYQRYPLELSGRICCKEDEREIVLTMEAPGKGKITLESRSDGHVHSFEVDKEGIWVYYDNMRIELSDTGRLPFKTVVDMLSLDNGHLVFSRKERLNGETVYLDRYEYEGEEISVYTPTPSDIPRSIHHTRDGVDTVLEIENINYIQG